MPKWILPGFGAPSGPEVASQPHNDLWIMHKSERRRQREPDVRIREIPSTDLLDPAEAVGNGIPMHAEGRRCLADSAPIEHGPEGREVLCPHVGTAREERSEERPGQPIPVAEMVQGAQHPIRRQERRLGDPAGIGEGLDGLERPSRLGFGRRPLPHDGEWTRYRDRPTKERGDLRRGRKTGRIRPALRIDRQDRADLERFRIASKDHPARRCQKAELASVRLAALDRLGGIVGFARDALPREQHDPWRPGRRERLGASCRVPGPTDRLVP